MSLKKIACSRLINQQIAISVTTTIKETVARMGAMQAQDYAMAKWAIGLRCKGTTNMDVEAAINKGDIIRTHVLRPTWHFIAAEDIYWMLELSAPQIKKLMKTRFKQFEFTDSLVAKSNAVIKKTVTGGKHCTRATLVAALHKANIKTDENRASHLLMYAELDAIICSGEIKNNQPTYALLKERVNPLKKINREFALEKLAKTYFASHGPATLADFGRWSGLPVKDATSGLEMIQPTLISETISNQTFWFSEQHSAKEATPAVYLLPAFDELLIGYKTREISIMESHHAKAFTKNGIFNPVIVKNGKVTGIWKRSFNKDKLTIEPAYFEPPDKTTINLVKKVAKKYGAFTAKKAEVMDALH
jgi:hypothetical protein